LRSLSGDRLIKILNSCKRGGCDTKEKIVNFVNRARDCEFKFSVSMIVFALLFFLGLSFPFNSGTTEVVGGMTHPQQMNPQVHRLALDFRDEIEAATGMVFDEYVPLEYTSQVCEYRPIFYSIVVSLTTSLSPARIISSRLALETTKLFMRASLSLCLTRSSSLAWCPSK
jgi:hypothetical protein